MKALQSIYGKAGRGTLNGRERAVKDINSVLDNTTIKMVVKAKGFVGQTASGFKWNFGFELPGVVSAVYYLKDDEPRNVLGSLAKFLRLEKVKKAIYSEVEAPCKCPKCGGSGILPEFYHYCNGICFDCTGIGIVGKLRVGDVQNKSELKGRPYLDKFRVSANYDEFTAAVENVKVIEHEGHPTAETFLAKDEDNFYIHQPVCRANSWYCIPHLEFEKFKETWNKFYPKNNL